MPVSLRINRVIEHNASSIPQVCGMRIMFKNTSKVSPYGDVLSAPLQGAATPLRIPPSWQAQRVCLSSAIRRDTLAQARKRQRSTQR